MRNATRQWILVCTMLLAPLARAQYVLELLVLDSASLEPIADVNVMRADGTPWGSTDREGVLTLRADRAPNGPITLQHVSYRDRRVSLPTAGGSLAVEMVPEAFILGQTVVRPEAPEIIFKSDTLHAAMFEPGADGLWVLAYARPRMWRDQARAGQEIFRDVVLVLLDTTLKERTRKTVPGECTGLHIGRRGEAYVVGVDRVWSVEYNDGRITYGTIITQAFREAVQPWSDSVAGHWLGSDFDPTFPGFDHLAYEPVSDIVSVFCSVEDTFVMDLFRSQYRHMSGHDKVIAMDAELRTGIDREIWAGYMTGFHNDLYFEAPYAPLFVSHDTILVFDHTLGRLRRFNRHREPIDQVPFDYHTGRAARAWTGRLLHDRVTGTVHATFEENGRTWLQNIDAASGELGPRTVLNARWPEQVRVHAGHAYYIHRPFESAQKRTLYRERVH